MHRHGVPEGVPAVTKASQLAASGVEGIWGSVNLGGNKGCTFCVTALQLTFPLPPVRRWPEPPRQRQCDPTRDWTPFPPITAAADLQKHSVCPSPPRPPSRLLPRDWPSAAPAKTPGSPRVASLPSLRQRASFPSPLSQVPETPLSGQGCDRRRQTTRPGI